MHTLPLFNKRIGNIILLQNTQTKVHPTLSLVRMVKMYFPMQLVQEYGITYTTVCLVFVKRIACSRRTDDTIYYIRIPTHFSLNSHTHTRIVIILYVLHYYCCYSCYLLLYIPTCGGIPPGQRGEVTCTRLLRPSIILLSARRWRR